MKVGSAIVVSALIALGGCASWLGDDPGASLGAAGQDCLQFYTALDRRIDVEGVRDGAAHRLAGFPYLRADRLTASYGRQIEALASGKAAIGDAVADRAAVDAGAVTASAPGADGAPDGRAVVAGHGSAGAARSAWVGRMAMLDRRARAYEVANLPTTAWPVAAYTDAAALNARVTQCSRLLVEAQALDPRYTGALVAASQVPDDYSRFKRAFGLYPLTGVGIASGIRRWEAQSRTTFERQRLKPAGDPVVFQRYGPEASTRDATSALTAARRVLSAAPQDALGIPLFDDASVAALARAYAPTFEIATSAEHDRFGPLMWIDLGGLVAPKADRYWLDVDPSQPVVYYQLAYTRFGGVTLPQILYTIWFPERMAAEGSDWEAGRIDGLIWRVTLDPEGRPLIYDAVHPSGCCHQFFNTRRLMPKAAPAGQDIGEWAFSPLGMPVEDWVAGVGIPGNTASVNGTQDGGGAVPVVGPLALRVASHNHQLVGIGDPASAWGQPLMQNPPYRLVPADDLRVLPRPGSSSRSVYDGDGQIVGSERFLRFALWPAGIDNAGAQRQSSRLPTAFIGRRHFDDPDLFDSRFRLRP